MSSAIVDINSATDLVNDMTYRICAVAHSGMTGTRRVQDYWSRDVSKAHTSTTAKPMTSTRGRTAALTSMYGQGLRPPQDAVKRSDLSR